MGTTDKLPDEMELGLEEALPGMRKTILKKLPLAVAAMIQARTPKTMQLSTLLPLETERADMREQWLRRLLTNRPIRSADVLEPFARGALEQAAAGGQYRLRLKGNLLVEVGCAGIGTTGELATGVRERHEANARLFQAGIQKAIGVLHEPGHPEPWIIDMDCPPHRAGIRDYAARWAIEPMSPDSKSRGFRLDDTKLEALKRLDCRILIMTLAMHWCAQAGQEDARCHPTATHQKPVSGPTPTTGVSEKPIAALSPGSNVAFASS